MIRGGISSLIIIFHILCNFPWSRPAGRFIFFGFIALNYFAISVPLPIMFQLEVKNARQSHTKTPEYLPDYWEHRVL